MSLLKGTISESSGFIDHFPLNQLLQSDPETLLQTAVAKEARLKHSDGNLPGLRGEGGWYKLAMTSVLCLTQE
jgi:hypothetical protein